jgi:pentatricopeptide repeat protein
MVGIRNGIDVKSSLRALRRIIQSGHESVHQSSSTDVLSSQQPLNAVLFKWKKEYIHQPETSVRPHDILQVVDAWKSFLDAARTTTAKGVISDASLPQRPDTSSYTYIIEAAAATSSTTTTNNRNESGDTDAIFADRLLTRLLQDAQTDFTLQPTPAAFAAVCKAWAKIANPQSSTSSTKIREWMRHMQQLSEEGWPQMEAPNILFWNILLNAWSKEGNVAKIEDTIQQMIQNEIGGVSPDTVSFSTLLAAYSRIGTIEAAESADSLLHQMVELYQNGVESAKPNVMSFTNVMQCHARLGNPQSSIKWLQELEELYNQTLDDDMKPDVAAYNTCLQAHVQWGNPQLAEDFLHSFFPADVPPNEKSYNMVLSAWAKAGDPFRAEATLLEMHDLYVQGVLKTTKPTVVSYNTVLSSYATFSATRHTKNNNNKRGDENVPWKRAQSILQHMISLSEMGDDCVKPNERTWNIVIDVCAKSGQAVVAEELLEKMINDRKDNKIVVSIRPWNAVLSACMHTADLTRARRVWNRLQNVKDSNVYPDIVSYNTYLNCYVRASMDRKRGEGGKHGFSKLQEEQAIEAIFRQLHDDPNVTPNRITYLAMINFWIARNEPERAEDVLLQLVNIVKRRSSEIEFKQNGFSPDRDLFHKVMDAWIPHQLPKKAEALLLTMSDHDGKNGLNLRPNVDTYNVVLECWAKSGRQDSGERAETILREMEALANSGDQNVCPNMLSYNRVLNAWANSKNPTAVTRTDSLVLEMILKQNSKTMPNAVSYNTWVKTIALSYDMDKAKRAKDVLKMMKIHDFRPSSDLLKKIQDLQGISSSKGP